MSKLSDRLQSERTRRKKTKRQFGDFMGVTEGQYGRYERGEQEPTVSKLENLADALGVSLDYLAGRTENPNVNE